KVKPRSSLDLYAATHWNRNAWHVELGYDFWFRSEESVSSDCSIEDVAIADLFGITLYKPVSASTAMIQQAITGTNPVKSDATFTPITINDINPRSGAAPMSFSNSVYASFAYAFQHRNHDARFGVNVAYERGHGVNVPDSVLVWIDFGIGF
ncbi:MAG TPA: hypothetical protein VI522_05430, partial [Gammaproteobacteria bacterium]|nr:hypothetical protein [Gammaproteobacteria bacterium]